MTAGSWIRVIIVACLLSVGGCRNSNGSPRGDEVSRCGESYWEGAGRDGTPCPPGYVLDQG